MKLFPSYLDNDFNMRFCDKAIKKEKSLET